MTPHISVILPVYNSEKFIRESVDSILKQTYTHFEFIIVNDGSTDKTKSIVYSFKDKRIKIINNKTRRGLSYCLNAAIKQAKGEYIARMDADDISIPERFEEQIEYLKCNSKISICGSWTKKMYSSDINKYPINPEVIKSSFIVNNPVAHPTVMIKKKIFTKYGFLYNEEFTKGQDYELWSKYSLYILFGNIPKPLLLYREHKDQVTQTHEQLRYLTVGKVRKALCKKLNIDLTPDEEFLIISCDTSGILNTISQIIDFSKLIKKIYEANLHLNIYDKSILAQVLGFQYEITVKNTRMTMQNRIRAFLSNPFKIATGIAASKYLQNSF